MKQHDDHKDAASVLRDEAHAAGLTDLVADVDHYIALHHRAVAAHASGNEGAKVQATMALGAGAAMIANHYPQVAGHPKVLAASKVCLAALCDAVKASI